MRTTRSFAIAVGALIVASVLSAASPVSAAEPFFMGLGHLAGGGTRSEASGLSGDGTTVVGRDTATMDGGLHAFRWRRETGMVDLGGGIANGVSRDGSVVVGWSGGMFRWTEAEGRQTFAAPSSAGDVTPDGSLIVGSADSKPARWTAATGFVPLGLHSPLISSGMGWAVSDDGSVVVGSVSYSPSGPFGEEAFRWTAATGMVGLGLNSFATDVSADGSVVVGGAELPGRPRQAFRWTQATGVVGLGGSGARVVSRDGSVVAGWDDSATPVEAFIWDAAQGMRRLESFLVGHGLNLDGWRLQDVVGISDDLTTFAGTGINPQGNQEAWIATIPEPTSMMLMALGLVLGGVVVTQRRRSKAFHAMSERPTMNKTPPRPKVGQIFNPSSNR